MDFPTEYLLSSELGLKGGIYGLRRQFSTDNDYELEEKVFFLQTLSL